MPSEEEIEKIIALHEDGKSQREIAEEIGKSQPTINSWIKDLIKRGLIKTDRSATKKATAAKIEYCAKKRIELIDKGLKKLEEMLPSIDKPNGMRDWFVALGTAIDKRRLEAPEKPPESESDGFFEALEAKTPEIWKDHVEADAVQVDPLQPQAMADPDLVDKSESN